MATEDLITRLSRQMDRVLPEVEMIRDDIADGEFSGARSHVGILRRRIADLDEMLLAAVRPS